MEKDYVTKELSWLSFNERVLQEAADKDVPLIERLRFLGIFSNNLDEFFKVRYATVKRIDYAGKAGKSQLGGIKASELLEIITNTVIGHQTESLKILSKIQKELEGNSAGCRKLSGTALKNSSTGETIYTPPQDINEINKLMANLEKFINDSSFCDYDPIVKMAIIHYQFESIHPFYDGNGRTGRIINILYLIIEKLQKKKLV